MKKALIIGVTGTIGSAVSKSFQEAGYQVTGVSRNTLPALDIEDPASVADFFAGSDLFDVIVCAAGTAIAGALEKLEEEDFQQSFNSKLMGQVRLVKHGLEKLNHGGTMLLTGGIFSHDPWPQTSAMALVNAGLEGFVRSVSTEVQHEKIVAVIHPPFIAETAKQFGMDPTPWPPAEMAGQQYLKAVAEAANGEHLFFENYHPKDY